MYGGSLLTAVPLPAVPVEPESEAVCECEPELAILCGSVVPPFVKYLGILIADRAAADMCTTDGI